jgi:hypothetical protein
MFTKIQPPFLILTPSLDENALFGLKCPEARRYAHDLDSSAGVAEAVVLPAGLFGLFVVS